MSQLLASVFGRPLIWAVEKLESKSKQQRLANTLHPCLAKRGNDSAQL
jgi:hypothetical protein